MSTLSFSPGGIAGTVKEATVMAVVRWEPTRELASMEVDRLHRMFDNFFGENLQRGWMPPVDIFETDGHEFVVKAELPGVQREDINLSFENNVLTIRGERKFTDEVKRDNYHRIERHYGSFSRSFAVPPTVDSSRIGASFKDGVLTIRMPQREEAKPKQIEVSE
jgi:HSP20 family protein